MSDERLSGIVDALYSRLILRDFFGKVVPGSIILLSIFVATFSYDDLKKGLDHISFLPGILLIGLSWILAFALQAFGETLHIICYHDCETNEEFYVKRHRFHVGTGVQQHQQLERLVVIREACGNGYLALTLSGAFLALNTLATRGPRALGNLFTFYWPVIVFAVLLVVFLAVMHFVHVRRQSEYINSFLTMNG